MTTFMISQNWSRRALLGKITKSASIATLAPFVPLLEAGAAETQPRRFMWFFTGQQPYSVKGFFPEQDGPTHFAAQSPYVGLNKYKEKIAVISGMDHKSAAQSGGAPHRRGSICAISGQKLRPAKGGEVKFYKDATLDGPGHSVDQVIARDLPKQNIRTLYPHLLTGFNQGGHNGERSFSYWNRKIIPLDENPAVLFDRLFKAAGNQGDSQTADPTSANRRSVLDYVYKTAERLKTKISVEDRAKLDQHLTSVRKVEQRIEDIQSTSCNGIDRSQKFNGDLKKELQVPKIMDAFFDLITLAFSCDLTRVASFQLSRGTDEHGYKWLDSKYVGNFHSWTHGLVSTTDPNGPKVANGEEWVRKGQIWRTDKFVKLLDRFDSINEGNGSMLDNSGILWWWDVSRGHDYDEMTWLVVGGMNGKFKVGERKHFAGAPQNRLLTTLAQAMGSNIEHVGGPQYGKGSFNSLLV